MITRQQIPQVLNHPLQDANGRKVGDVKNVFQDDATGRPEWLGVQTGMMGNKETFVPVVGSDLVSDHIESRWEKDFIKQAPEVAVDGEGHMSSDEVRRLYQYYNIEWGRTVEPRPTGDDAMTRSEERLHRRQGDPGERPGQAAQVRGHRGAADRRPGEPRGGAGRA